MKKTFEIPPPGFRGLVRGVSVEQHRRHLPHWRQEGATYFVTFRLGDSLPASRLNELRQEREEWEHFRGQFDDEAEDEFRRKQMEKVDRWLDQGHGSCILGKRTFAEMVEGRLRYFDGERYSLFSFVIMPNHVHVCVKPHPGHELDSIIRGWKGVSARMINKSRSTNGTIWQDERYDRIVRDAEHLRKVVRYIEANSAKAGVDAVCWTTPIWDKWLGRERTDA